MFLSPLIHAVQSRLAVKLALIFFLFGVISILLTMGFMVYQRSLLTGEILKRAQEQTQYLAHNCRYTLKENDQTALRSLVSGVKASAGLDALLADAGGKILARSDAAFADSILALPPERDKRAAQSRITAEGVPVIRTIAPVEINYHIVDTHSQLYAHQTDRDISIGEFVKSGELRYTFPNFSPDSRRILCSLQRMHDERKFLVSVSLADSSQRLLISGGVSNGFWSHSGKYLVYCHTVPEKNPVLCVYDTDVDSSRVITTEGTGFPNSCFTPDDRYIITGLSLKRELMRLYQIPRGGGKPEQLTFHSGNHWYPKCSSDGEWILYSYLSPNYDGTASIYTYGNKTKAASPLFPALKDPHRSGSFSPDGKRICYLRRIIRDSWDIYVTDFPADETKSPKERYGRQITFTGGDKFFYTDWSPDGEWIAYSQKDNITQRYDICIVSPKTGEIRNLTAAGPSYKQLIGYAALDIPVENLDRAVAAGNRIALTVGIIFTVLGMLAAFLLVRSIVRPVQVIADAAGEVANGNLDSRVDDSRSDEIGTLARSFNRMTGQLKTSKEAVTAGSQELEREHYKLEGAYRELDTLDKAKDNFISLVSHEIRTPLSSILLYAEMLMNGLVKSRDTARKYHATIVDECKRLTRLINDVLDLSKMEAGRLTFHPEVLDMKEMVKDIHAHFQPLLESRELRFIDEGGPDGMRLKGDRDRITQVLTNIISNAIKFTPADGVIRVSWKREDGKGTVAVSDTGKGIEEEDIPKVFDRFTQLENIDHHTEGTGLGMAISKLIIERSGGSIWIESTPGKGTNVFFTLPLADAGDALHEPEEAEPAGGKSDPLAQAVASGHPAVLIADDEEPIRVALTECVRSAGFIPITASDGRETLRLARLHRPSVVVLDVMMPEISGLEVCRKLRDDTSTHDIGIIILSARGQEKERREGLRAGADRYIIKPFSYEEVMGAIRELMRG